MAIINDGHPTTVTFSSGESGVVLSELMFEKEVTPPGVSGGGPNDTSTMRNSVWRTMQPKSLKSLTPLSFTAAYDPAVFDEIVAMANVNQSIVVTFADGSTLTFWGWLDEFTPNAVVEGEQPTAEVTVVPSNQNGSGVETAPLYAAA